MAWDRKGRFWSRFAVGGEIVEAPVTGLALDKAGKLRVTVREKGKGPRQFEYDQKNRTWEEVR